MFGCGTTPAVTSMFIPFLPSTSASQATETVALTTAGSRASPTGEQIYPKLAVSAGVIAGSVIAGLVVIAVAAVGLAYILRRHGGRHHHHWWQ